MGCFSYLCGICHKGVNSSSFSGEHCKMYLLIDGEIVETMEGNYDSYGRVFNINKRHEEESSFSWRTIPWGEVVDLCCDDDDKSGIAIVHTDCLAKYPQTPTIRSEGDPEQGWGIYTHTKRGPNNHWVKEDEVGCEWGNILTVTHLPACSNPAVNTLVLPKKCIDDGSCKYYKKRK